MRYICVDPAEYIYPDRFAYATGSDRICVYTPRDSYACAQILLSDLNGDETVTVACEGWSPELYRMVPVFVERNESIGDDNRAPHQPEREAPYYVYEALAPIRGGKLTAENGVCALYLAWRIEADAEPGIKECAVTVNGCRIPVTVEVSPVTVPAETLHMIHGYARQNVAKYHNCEVGSPEFNALDDQYLRMMRRIRQNILYCPGPEKVVLDNGEFDVKFDAMEAFMKQTMVLGYQRFIISIGGRVSWKASTIRVYGMDSMSFECYKFLAKMLPALVAFLKERGWLDRIYMSISDEPNEANATEYRALCGLVRKFAPEIKLLDAMSFGPVHGAVDVWVPINDEYDRHREEIEVFRKNGDEIWYYDCCGPRGWGYINRFIDYALLATRYHFWANYRYDLKGYLHWAANYYMPGQDPFKQSCPEHHNADSMCYLPAGDTHIIYPGDGEPWMSIRLENLRASAEEYELLKLLAESDRELADEICLSVFRSFKDVTYDVKLFRNARERLLRALEARK